MTAVRPFAPAPLAEEDLDFVLARTAPLWEGLRDGRLFLTGGTGFFGLWLLETFLWANDRLGLSARVTVLARDQDRFVRRAPHLAAHPAVAFLAHDVRTFAFPAGEFTHVVHAATDSTPPATADHADRMVDTVVNGTRRVLRFAAECGAQKFLFASSGAVYGPQSAERVAEDDAGAPALASPIAPYAEGKRLAEVLVGRAAGFDATIARGFAFVGPHLPLDAHFAIGNFIRDALAGEPLLIRGDATTVRSYLYAADLAVWLWTILLRGDAGRAYNVGSERAVTIGELAHVVASAVGTEAPVRVAPTTSITTSPRYVPCTARARGELGLVEAFSLEDAIRRTASYHRLLAEPGARREALHAP